MKIVPFEARHVKPAAELERLCFSAPWSEEALREELCNPRAVFRAAEDEEARLMGYIGMHHAGDEGFITNVAVHSFCRRIGVASALLSSLTAYAAEQALARLTLEVRVSNTAAIALYEGLGFTRDGVRPGFYTAPPEDAAIYSLWL